MHNRPIFFVAVKNHGIHKKKIMEFFEIEVELQEKLQLFCVHNIFFAIYSTMASVKLYLESLAPKNFSIRKTRRLFAAYISERQKGH
jgi:hypothetical protein